MQTTAAFCCMYVRRRIPKGINPTATGGGEAGPWSSSSLLLGNWEHSASPLDSPSPPILSSHPVLSLQAYSSSRYLRAPPVEEVWPCLSSPDKNLLLWLVPAHQPSITQTSPRGQSVGRHTPPTMLTHLLRQKHCRSVPDLHRQTPFRCVNYTNSDQRLLGGGRQIVWWIRSGIPRFSKISFSTLFRCLAEKTCSANPTSPAVPSSNLSSTTPPSYSATVATTNVPHLK